MKFCGLLTVSLGLCYLLLWFSFSSYPFLDLPNHLSRAYIISELLTAVDSPFQKMFYLEPSWSTYILGDILLTPLVLLFGMKAASALWISLSFFLLPISLFYYLKERNLSRELLFCGVLFVFYLSSNWFFLSGFFNYSIGVGMVFFILCLWEKLFKEENMLSWLFFIYSTTIAFTYLMHLAAFFFAGVIVAISSVYRLSRVNLGKQIARTVFWGVPFALVILLHFLLGNGEGQFEMEHLMFRDPVNKLLAVSSMFYRFSLPIDITMLAIFLISLGYYIFKNLRIVKEPLLITGVIFLIYLVLPVAIPQGYDVDNRALPFLFLFVLISGCVAMGVNRKASVRLFVISFILASTNLVYLGKELHQQDKELVSITEAIKSIPKGKIVLPVATKEDVGRIQTSLHAGSLYTSLREGYTPYLFSRSIMFPQTYFVYFERLYAPTIFWYQRKEDNTVRWNKISELYDFLLVTKPYKLSRFKLENLEIYFENTHAVVLRNGNRSS